jgi:DHA1 family inner membrane transport protein
VIAAGLGYLAPAWAGAVLALAGLVIAVVAVVLERRSGGPGPSTMIG